MLERLRTEFHFGQRGEWGAAVWVKVHALFSTLTPPAARAAGFHFREAELSILRRWD